MGRSELGRSAHGLRPRPAQRLRTRLAGGPSPCALVPTRAQGSLPLTSVCACAPGSVGCAGRPLVPRVAAIRLPVAGVPSHPERDYTQPLAGPGAVAGRGHPVCASAGETGESVRTATGTPSFGRETCVRPPIPGSPSPRGPSTPWRGRPVRPAGRPSRVTRCVVGHARCT